MKQQDQDRFSPTPGVLVYLGLNSFDWNLNRKIHKFLEHIPNILNFETTQKLVNSERRYDIFVLDYYLNVQLWSPILFVI